MEKYDLTHYEAMLLEEYLDSFSQNEKEQKRKEALSRLQDGEPIAYLLGKQYFYNMHFKVTADTLIPRPDTEHTVDLAIKTLPENGRFIDLCTGSGCIALTILKNRPDLCAAALDISEKALCVAKENAVYWELSDRVRFIKSDILRDRAIDEKFDAVISNPPYIKSSDMTKYPSLRFEPRIALDAGDDAMIFYKTIISRYLPKLSKNGVFIFEIGYDQGDEIRALANQNGLECSVIKDFSKNDRVALIKAQKTEKEQ